MDQQQFKIRMSVSTKLLLVISFLLTTPIFFLNVSAITLFRNDKKAYVYDSQATAAVLAGREFVSYLDNSLGTLKLIVGSLDMTHALSDQAKNNISFYLDNQHGLLGTELYASSGSLQSANLIHQQFLPSATDKGAPAEQELPHLDVKSFERHASELEQRGFFFENISKAGKSPVLAIVFADLARTKAGGPAPIAVGYVSLQHFLSGSSNSFNRFLIADKAGELLFSSDLKLLYSNENQARNEIFKEAWNTQITSGAREYKGSDGILTLGSFYKPGLDLVALSQIEYDKAMRATYTLTEKFVILGLAALSIMIVLALIFSKRLTAPLNRLFKATAQVSGGNFDIDLPVSSRDEIGALTNSFVAMSRKISDLVQEMVDKVRVDQELEIAKTVQQSLFPPTTIQNEHLLAVSHYQSASECGGDWWGYFRTGNKHTFVIADATGHGLPSALMTASARSCFSVLEKLAGESRFNLNPAEMLSVANRVVFDAAQGKIMMTCFACVIDFDTHVITYSSAGHNPPWLFNPKEGGGFKLSSLVCKSMRLGEIQEAGLDAYELKQMEFTPGDTLFLYTDGLIEGKNLTGEQYGKKKSRSILEETMGNPPDQIITNLMTDFLGHNSGKPLDDDVTLAVIRLLS